MDWLLGALIDWWVLLIGRRFCRLPLLKWLFVDCLIHEVGEQSIWQTACNLRTVCLWHQFRLWLLSAGDFYTRKSWTPQLGLVFLWRMQGTQQCVRLLCDYDRYFAWQDGLLLAAYHHAYRAAWTPHPIWVPQHGLAVGNLLLFRDSRPLHKIPKMRTPVTVSAAIQLEAWLFALCK